MDNSEAIQVCVRVRPILPFEYHSDSVGKHEAIVEADRDQASVRVGSHQAQFDEVFGPDASYDDVFGVVRSHIDGVLQGINTTVFAYGQTGSGKTHSMLGAGLESTPTGEAATAHPLLSAATKADPTVTPIRSGLSSMAASGGGVAVASDSVPPTGTRSQASTPSAASATGADDETPVVEPGWGIMPRAVARIFDLIGNGQQQDSTFSASVTASYIELYNDKCYDLLQDPRRAKPLAIREKKGAGRSSEVYVEGLSQVVVDSTSGVMRALQRGSRNRAVRATELNASSSRSHAILQLSLDVEQGTDGGVKVLRRAKLSLVDLAGSEKWDVKLELGRARAKELTHINKSLSALGNCIAALTDTGRRHIPYRDSKLTRLLQDSLGGTARTTVIATLSPTAANKEDSISTMVFADRARRVMVNVRPHEVVDDAILLAQANQELDRLRSKVRRLNRAERRAAELENVVDYLRAENARLRQLLGYRGRSSKKDSSRIQSSPQSRRELPQPPYQGRVSVSPMTSPRAAIRRAGHAQPQRRRKPRKQSKARKTHAAARSLGVEAKEESPAGSVHATPSLRAAAPALALPPVEGTSTPLRVGGSGALGAHDGDGLSDSSLDGSSSSSDDDARRGDYHGGRSADSGYAPAGRAAAARSDEDEYSDDSAYEDEDEGGSSGGDSEGYDSDEGEDELYRPFEPNNDKVKYYVALANLIDSDEEQTEVGQRITRLANSFRGKDVYVARDAGGALVVRSETKGLVAQVKLSELADEARRSILQQEGELLRGVRSIAKEKANLQKMLEKLLEGRKETEETGAVREAGSRPAAQDMEQFVRAKLDVLCDGSSDDSYSRDRYSDEEHNRPVLDMPTSSHSHERAPSVGDPQSQDGLISARRASSSLGSVSGAAHDSNSVPYRKLKKKSGKATSGIAAQRGRRGRAVAGVSGVRTRSSAGKVAKKRKVKSKSAAPSPASKKGQHHQHSAAAIDALIADPSGPAGWGGDGGVASRGWSPESSGGGIGMMGGDDTFGAGIQGLQSRYDGDSDDSEAQVRSPRAAPKAKRRLKRKRKTRRGSAASEIRSGDLYKDGRAMGRREASDDDRADWKLSQLHKGGVGALDIDIVAYTHANPTIASGSRGGAGSGKKAKKAKRGRKQKKRGPGTGRFRFDRRDAGCRVAIRAARYGTMLKGTIAAFDAPRNMHLVVYDSGERRWHDMMQKEFRVLKYVDAQKRRDEREEAQSDRSGSGLDGDIPTSDIDANAAAATFAYAPVGDAPLSSTNDGAFYMEAGASLTPVLSRPSPQRHATKSRRKKDSNRSISRTKGRRVKRKGAQARAPSLGMAGFGQRARPSRKSGGRAGTGIRQGSVRDAGGTGALVVRYGNTYASGIVKKYDGIGSSTRRSRVGSSSGRGRKGGHRILPPL